MLKLGEHIDAGQIAIKQTEQRLHSETREHCRGTDTVNSNTVENVFGRSLNIKPTFSNLPSPSSCVLHYRH